MSRRLLAALLLLAPLVASGAAALEPKKASEIVKINQTGSLCPLAGYALDDRQLPNGESGSFSIPDGKVLIVTGVTWSATSGTPGAPVIGALSSQTPQGLVSHYYSTATFASDGSVLQSVLTPPIVIGAGRSICFYVTAGNFNAATVHGFFAADK